MKVVATVSSQSIASNESSQPIETGHRSHPGEDILNDQRTFASILAGSQEVVEKSSR